MCDVYTNPYRNVAGSHVYLFGYAQPIESLSFSVLRSRPLRVFGSEKASSWGDHRRVKPTTSIQNQQMHLSTRYKEVGYSSMCDVGTKQIAQKGKESTRKRLELDLSQIQMQDLGGINDDLDLFLHSRL